jgi:Flp pilus assembly protein TadD
MRDTEHRAKGLVMRAATLVGLLLALLFAGCASVPPATQGEQAESGAPLGGVVAGPPADGTTTPATTGSTGKSATKAVPSGAKTRASIPASPASASQLPKKDSIAPELAKQKASPPFDLTSLELRLKETQAIGVLAKIALRNQVDDLLSQFRSFHQGKLKTTLAELRRPYDLLVVRLLSLLQDNDPSLASALVASREAIWGILSDPAKFATI